MVNFLSITFPDETKPLFSSAAPLLHRWILALGSFPYHNTPAESLTLDILQVAVIILLRRHEAAAGLLDSDEPEANLAILFQSLSKRPENTPQTSDKERNEADDEHLRSVYDFVARHNKWSDKNNPKLVKMGPELPPMSQSPSSFSQDLSGRIPAEEFRPFLGLLLCTQLYADGIGPETVSVSSAESKEVAESIANTFQENQSEDITWVRFNRTMKYSTVPIYAPLCL